MKNLLIDLRNQISDFDKSGNDHLKIKYEIDEVKTFSEFGDFVKNFVNQIILPKHYSTRFLFDKFTAYSTGKQVDIYFEFKPINKTQRVDSVDGVYFIKN